jgi:ribosome-binding factor A
MERKDKVANLIRKLAAEFLGRENNQTSLLTVSRVDVSPDLRNATVFFTVLPETKESGALEFAKRRRSNFRDILKANIETKNIPFIDFEIDKGEKNRQKIDELLREK